MIDTRFEPQKATQVAHRFLALSGGEMSYMRLIKLMYMADRKAYAELERPITGDKYFSMDNGPVLSTVLNIIKDDSYIPPSEKSYWNKHIYKNAQYSVKIKSECDYDELSDSEIAIIDSIHEEFKGKDRWEVRNYCHEKLPEWKGPKGTSIRISPEEILSNVGKSSEEIEEIREELESVNYLKEILGA
ncbi:MAG: DUF4065 domain-containing protein [Candidatus Glassbacteria bacterium]|nr:DUF4065 domain-containing protein [Candidatus Glassbacteria bacterium]